jgi:hypothetical protein
VPTTGSSITLKIRIVYTRTRPVSGIEEPEAQGACSDDEEEEEEDQLHHQLPPQLMWEFEVVEEELAGGFEEPDLPT